MFTKTFIAAATLVLASTFAPSIAAAASDGAYEVSAAAVQTDDLNLSTPTGKATLKTRIAHAVNKVCGVTGGTIDLEERRAINLCHAKAREAAFAAAKVREESALAAR